MGSDPTFRALFDGLTYSDLVALRNRETRDQLGLYLAEGTRFLSISLQTGAPIIGIIVSPRLIQGLIARGLIEQAKVPTAIVSMAEFAELSVAAEPQGIILVLGQCWHGLPARVGRRDLWLGIERIRTAGNLGTMMRTAAAVGATGIMVFGPPRDRSDPYDPGSIRASMGACFRLKFVQTSHRQFRAWSSRYELRTIGSTADADRDYRTINYRKPTMIMLGNERDGLSEGQTQSCDWQVKIPMVGELDSLNVAMASAILLYEARNQRGIARRGFRDPRR